jgi:hypothetical protein
LLVAWAARASGLRYEGIEFSPYSFQTRAFVYQLPVFSRFGKGVTTIDVGSPIASSDIMQYLSTPTQTPVALARWDLVQTGGTASASPYLGEAATLVNSIKNITFSANQMNWEGWSADHPSLAAILWPAVQQIAIHHAYFVIPELLAEIERGGPQESKIREKIEKFSISGAILQSERLIAMKDWENAVATIRWGLSFGDNEDDAPQKNDHQDSSNRGRLRELLRQAEPNVDPVPVQFD